VCRGLEHDEEHFSEATADELGQPDTEGEEDGEVAASPSLSQHTARRQQLDRQRRYQQQQVMKQEARDRAAAATAARQRNAMVQPRSATGRFQSFQAPSTGRAAAAAAAAVANAHEGALSLQQQATVEHEEEESDSDLPSSSAFEVASDLEGIGMLTDDDDDDDDELSPSESDDTAARTEDVEDHDPASSGMIDDTSDGDEEIEEEEEEAIPTRGRSSRSGSRPRHSKIPSFKNSRGGESKKDKAKPAAKQHAGVKKKTMSRELAALLTRKSRSSARQISKADGVMSPAVRNRNRNPTNRPRKPAATKKKPSYPRNRSRGGVSRADIEIVLQQAIITPTRQLRKSR